MRENIYHLRELKRDSIQYKLMLIFWNSQHTQKNTFCGFCYLFVTNLHNKQGFYIEY